MRLACVRTQLVSGNAKSKLSDIYSTTYTFILHMYAVLDERESARCSSVLRFLLPLFRLAQNIIEDTVAVFTVYAPRI